jgi:hypothetical protein
MITIEAEDEDYCLVTDGKSWTVLERRAGKFHPLGNCSRPGVGLDDPATATFLREGRTYSEPVARHLLTDTAAEWRDLLEHLR